MSEQQQEKPEGLFKGLFKVLLIAVIVYALMTFVGGNRRGGYSQGGSGYNVPQGYDRSEMWGPEAYMEPPGHPDGMMEGYKPGEGFGK